jgi:hypothetical protein
MSTVELKRERDGVVFTFSKEVAQAILRSRKSTQKMGWLLNDKKLKFNGHDIIRKSSYKSNPESNEEESSS